MRNNGGESKVGQGESRQIEIEYSGILRGKTVDLC